MISTGSWASTAWSGGPVRSRSETRSKSRWGIGAEMASEERVTYCRICEPLCGMVATVEDGRVTKLRPDADHPLSRGFACPKGIAMTEVQNDPDRVLYPLRRVKAGEASANGAPEGFERVSWDEAL